MLAGIVITVMVLATLGLGLPWLVNHRDDDDVLDSDPSERFSDTMRILRRDVVDYAREVDTEVSTPLTRRAEMKELRLLAISAARRRRRVMTSLVVATLLGLGLSLFSVVPWWVPVIPASGLVTFMILARVGVAMMYRRFDARAAKLKDGFDEAEATTVLKLDEAEPSTEMSIDLSAPEETGGLWEPVPVVAPTYVSKPLVPRTVRTIDLSAPVVGDQVVPTAENPDALVADQAGTSQGEGRVVSFRKAAGQ
ncbi:hypothetical protein EII34_07220 [Arachnia propionica]|uniref:Uncharacterized protein n=1 Tax=Arachnia propionica TaxID=1750 RepID=A0A3P1T740_9ACTN|nr:hypothetical protein [Arachnia propionica]RRD05128.1 hypothetical protein EII34_07220 [Arachnia propionica]